MGTLTLGRKIKVDGKTHIQDLVDSTAELRDFLSVKSRWKGKNYPTMLGSADFTSVFLEAPNPIATVISSGDDEPHAHPRAETLGTVGMFSRGARPLIFSTELARSAKDRVKHPSVVREAFREAKDELLKLQSDPSATPKQIEKAFRIG